MGDSLVRDEGADGLHGSLFRVDGMHEACKPNAVVDLLDAGHFRQ